MTGGLLALRLLAWFNPLDVMFTLSMRRGVSSVAVWFGVAVVVATLYLLVMSIAHTMRHVKPVRSTVPPVSAVVWGDRVFFKPPTLAHWLKVRGIGYSVWAGRHPPANRLLKSHQAPPQQQKKKR